MKREYLEPRIILIFDTETELLAGGSGVTGGIDDDVQINYGGVDEDGSKDPEAKQHFSLWED